jgi:predicted dehydrogenase
MSTNREQAPGGKVRYAVIGLGWIAQEAMLPAFAHAKDNSKLTALVSDDPKKRDELGEKYGVELRYAYDEFDQCLASGQVDAVYIALPNDMHREYTERAARAGVHVLCEKPMANSEDECAAMIRAAEENRVKLMIAYRLHLEEANMKAVEIVASGELGDPRIFNSVFTEVVQEGNIRLDRQKGGGPLWDIGVYCLNAARYLFRAEPIEAVALRGDSGEAKFRDVEETVGALLRFPEGRLATFTCSFGAANVSSYQVVGTRGDLRMDPAYGFTGGLKASVTIDGRTEEHAFKARDQFAAQLQYFSRCILEGTDPEPSGLEGLADIRILTAIRRSAEAGGTPVPLDQIPRKPRPSAAQVIKGPAPSSPGLIHASDPSGQS